MKTTLAVISNEAHPSRRRVPLLFFQHPGLWKFGHGGSMSADPPQPRGLSRAVPEALLRRPVRRAAERGRHRLWKESKR